MIIFKVNVPSLGLHNVLSLLVHYKHPILAFKKIPTKMLVLVYNVHRRRKKTLKTVQMYGKTKVYCYVKPFCLFNYT